jgi:hypothetical protein
VRVHQVTHAPVRYQETAVDYAPSCQVATHLDPPIDKPALELRRDGRAYIQ